MSLIGIDSELPATAANADVHESVTTLQSLLHKHARLRATSRKEQHLSEKRWIAKEILKCIKIKNTLFRKYFQSNDPVKKKQIIKNILTR